MDTQLLRSKLWHLESISCKVKYEWTWSLRYRQSFFVLHLAPTRISQRMNSNGYSYLEFVQEIKFQNNSILYNTRIAEPNPKTSSVTMRGLLQPFNMTRTNWTIVQFSQYFNHYEEQDSSLGRRLRQASAILFAKRACPFANSWKATPISNVFCSWKRTISSFIRLTIVSNLLVASSLSAFNCITKPILVR